MNASKKPPLDGFKVLDLSRVLAGPWCTMTLADLGADVIKIEHPLNGDDTRGWAPFKAGQSAYFLFLNRNKRSVAMDITDPEVQEILHGYIAEADIIVENYRAGALKKYRLDYETARRINPRIIYCSVTGYGHASPMSSRPGYDFVAQAEGGMMSVNGDVDGAPTKVAVAIGDLLAGMNATQSVLAAVIARGRDGTGQHLDIALLDGQVAAMMNVASEYLITGVPPRRLGNAHPSVVPYQTFPAADGYFVLAVGNNSQFLTLCRDVIDRPGLASDERFRTNALRVENRDALSEILSVIFKVRPAAEWLEQLTASGVPNGKIRNIAEVLNAPEVIARDMVWRVEHPELGSFRMIGSPLKFSETKLRVPSAPPTLGQHNTEVLREVFKLSTDRMAALRSRGVLGGSDSTRVITC